jgi:hypothetical protein
MANNEYSHYFHAEAHALSGNLILPFRQEIKKQAYVKLEGELEKLHDSERALRNYFSEQAQSYRLEGIISYSSAHTQVSGHRSDKHEAAWVTLATSVVEDLNILNVVTVDRVVAQIVATYFKDCYAPEVTFVGTQFDNLKIAGHRVEPFLNVNLMSGAPGDRNAMHVDQGTSLMAAIEKQYSRLKAKLEDVADAELKKMRLQHPGGTLGKYDGFADLNYGNIKAGARAAQQADLEARRAGKKPAGEWDGVTCSLVEDVELESISGTDAERAAHEINPPARPFGHVIHVPHFGNVFLAELTVKHNSYNLTMIRTEMGCATSGSTSGGGVEVNGGGGK